MPYCSKCGSILSDEDKFCSNCGNLVNLGTENQNQIPINTAEFTYGTKYPLNVAEAAEMDANISIAMQLNKFHVGLLVWGVILFIPTFALSVSYVVNEVIKMDVISIVVSIVISVMLVGGPIGMILGAIISNSARKKNLVMAKDKAWNRIIELEAKRIGMDNYDNLPVEAKIGILQNFIVQVRDYGRFGGGLAIKLINIAIERYRYGLNK